MTSLAHSFTKLCDYWLIKAIALCSLFSYDLFFGDVPLSALKGVVILVVIDLFTAMFATAYLRRVKGDKAEGIKSNKIKRTLYKIAVYAIMIMTAAITESVAGLDFFATEAVLAVVGVTEFISIFENIGRMGFVIPKKLLDKLKEFKGDQ